MKHGMSNTRIHRIWRGLNNHCKNPNNYSYALYGARGISVCDEWSGEDGFINFYHWSMSNGYTDEMSIDRIDNDGDYEPENCRWATKCEQARNKRNSVFVEYEKRKRPLIEVATENGINYRTFHGRISKGMSVQEALINSDAVKRAKGFRTAKIDIRSGEIIEIYKSANEAARKNGFDRCNGICLCCEGKMKTSGGYAWKYLN